MVKVETVKVFTTDCKKGNLAGVVLDATTLTEHAMQEIAKAVNASETSFVFPSERADLRVRWFTPKNEVGICVHATIAAIGAWAEYNNDLRRSFSVETRHAVLRAERDGGVVYINVPGYFLEARILDETAVLDILEIDQADVVRPLGVIRIYEDAELVVPVRSLSILESLRPDVERFSEICREVDVTGICIFTRASYSGAHDIHMREFAPLYGYLEDPLCGMASGCVLTYLRAHGVKVDSLKVEQGHFCGTSGTILVRYDSKSGTWIGGEHTIGRALEVGV